MVVSLGDVLFQLSDFVVHFVDQFGVRGQLAAERLSRLVTGREFVSQVLDFVVHQLLHLVEFPLYLFVLAHCAHQAVLQLVLLSNYLLQLLSK